MTDTGEGTGETHRREGTRGDSHRRGEQGRLTQETGPGETHIGERGQDTEGWSSRE